MSFNLSFSCNYTEINIKEWSAKGYEIELIDRPNYGKNRQAVIVTKTTYTDDDDVPVIEKFGYMMTDVALVTGSDIRTDKLVIPCHDKLIIPQQGHVDLETEEHPRNDECIFLNLKDVDITEITIDEGFDHNASCYRCYSEEKFVLDLLIGLVGVYVPFTQKWVDFYKEYGELAEQITHNNRLMLKNQMKLLMKLKVDCWN